MKNYRYSVVIPHYRDLEGLKKLIPTIPEREDIQIIIVDDNSYPDTDRVAQVVNSLEHRNVLLLYNEKEKRGAGGCRNIGIEAAEGEWLVFSDADDYFVEGAFNRFDKHSSTIADIVYFHMTSINMPQLQLGTRHLQYVRLVDAFLKRPNRNNELNLRYNFPSPCAKMVRHQMVKDNGIWYEDVRWSNDDMFATKCGYYATSIEADSSDVYCVIRKNGTITTAKSEEAIRTKIDVYIRKTLYLKEHLSSGDFRKVTRWPGNKLILEKLEHYNEGTSRYIKEEFKKNGISLFWINRNDLFELLYKVKSYLHDRNYE